MKLPVIKAFGDTFALVFGNFLDVIKIVIVPVLVFAGLGYWLMPRLFDQLTQFLDTAESMSGQHDPAAIFAAIQPIMSASGIVFLAEIIVIPMMVAGLLRLAINNEKPAFVYLSWGGNEFRVLITFILKGLLLFVIYIIGALAIAALAIGLNAAAKEIAPIVGLVLGVGYIVLLIWIALRLSLSSAAAVGSGKIGIGPSWSATKGAVWSLLFYWILWWVLLAVVQGVFMAFFMPGMFASFATIAQSASVHAGGNAEGARAVIEAERQMFQSMSHQLPLLIGFGAVMSLVVYPLLICSAGVAWRLLAKESQSTEA